MEDAIKVGGVALGIGWKFDLGFALGSVSLHCFLDSISMYIVICFERKTIMMSKYEKCNICFSLWGCHKRSQHVGSFSEVLQ